MHYCIAGVADVCWIRSYFVRVGDLVLLGVYVLVTVLVDDGVNVFDTVNVSDGVNDIAGRRVAVRDTLMPA